jgi:hypothetical protein
MENPQDQQLLERYLYHILRKKEENKNRFTQEELNQIAKDLGFTEKEWLAIEKEGEKHAQRAESYLKVERYSESESELQKACEISPLNPQYLAQMAELQVILWKKGKGKNHLNLAEQFAKRALEVEPSSQKALKTFEQINQLKKGKGRKRIFLGIIAFVLAIPLGLFVLIAIDELVPKTPTGFEGKKYVAEAVYTPSPDLEGLKLTFSKSKIIHDTWTPSKSIGYDLVINVLSEKYEISELSVKLDFLGENDTLLMSESMYLISPFRYSNVTEQYSLRPNVLSIHTIGRSYLNFQDNKPQYIKKIRVSPENYVRNLPPVQYPKMDTIPLIWNCMQLPHLSFQVFQRKNYLDTSKENKSSTHYAWLEIAHTGKDACQELKIRLEWLKNGNSIRQVEYPLLTNNDSIRLLPQQKVSIVSEEYFHEESYGNPAFDSFTVSVLSAQ